MPENNERLIDYKILLRAPGNLLDPSKGENAPSVYYEIAASPETWKVIPEEHTGVLKQLASLNGHLANIPMGRFLGGACVFVNMELIVDNE